MYSGNNKSSSQINQ